MLDTARDVPTPEGIELSLRVAGPVPRAYAWVIDFMIRVAIALSAQFAIVPFGKFGWGALLILWFALEWLYPVLFEVYWQGATPGKRRMGLVVLHDDGTPVRMPASLTRNLLRAIDFAPMLYGFGLFAMLLSRDFKRLGDLAAGTVVVYRAPAVQHAAIPSAAPLMPPLSLSLTEQRTVLDLATRAPSLTPERAQELAALAPHLTEGLQGQAALDRLLAIANYLIGRKG
jgi:uncharacterized RDD family membrane protein YckC